jgi:hypothetical protein
MRHNKHDKINFFASSKQGPNPSFSNTLSDHAYQSSCFNILNDKRDLIHNGIINVGTWNLMNKCFSKNTDEQRKKERNGTTPQNVGAQIKTKNDYIDRYRKRKKLSIFETDEEIKKVMVQIQNLQNTLDINADELITNNPYNIDETIKEYEQRKMVQIEKIIDNIRSKNSDDIICLQEVDFLTTKPSRIYDLLDKEYKQLPLTNDEQAKLKNIKPFELEQAKLYKCQLKLREYCAHLLKNENYSIVTTNDILADRNGTTQQKFATIYNNIRFDFKKGCGALPTEPTNPSETRQYRGFEIYLHDKKLGEDICITNVHLTYGKDYNEDIKEYQKSMQQKGIFHVMAGDTNNLQCIQYKTALGTWSDATNFEGEFDKQNRLTGVTTLHKGTQKQKAYDRFFVVAPNNHYVTIKPNNDRNMKFVVSEESGRIRLEKTSSEHVAITGLGTPYQRGVDELTRLYQKISKFEVHTEYYDKVLDNMVEVIYRKGVRQQAIERIVSDPEIYGSLCERLDMKHNNNVIGHP